MLDTVVESILQNEHIEDMSIIFTKKITSVILYKTLSK